MGVGDVVGLNVKFDAHTVLLEACVQRLNHLGVKLPKDAVAALNNRHRQTQVANVFSQLDADETSTKDGDRLVLGVRLGQGGERSLHVIGVGDIAQPHCAFDARNF